MLLHEEHPRFDRANEFLCLLSANPQPTKLLAEDLQIKTHGGNAFAGLLKTLSGRGVRVDVLDDFHGVREMAIAPAFVERAKKLGGEYFDTVYGQ